MTLKPSVMSDVPADITSVKKAIGPKLAEQYCENPKVAKYAFVLKFPDGVITGRAVSHALRKIPAPRGPTLLAGVNFTVEAMGLAKAESCDVIAVHEFFWTDASYADRVSDRPLRG
ncbi:hypothetical protein EDE08_111156 [Bradyrhizobium sp. R2.2-H]|uniref:hypothetical protein n=1 Tax=unclassified Bradyrhizobium TaxID=2631580 RepID=UPI0010508716|nr:MULTISPECIES: hypothetical protein [unclassified Bradyrhizobium]TCU66598.1 hypothetical protein EDE10_111156 [Bradyrhizobium sp. Y-H1]TCU68747.1 hypothetical protein EDE08_111156 [Bradyrhizobium sp. R2.2-H]